MKEGAEKAREELEKARKEFEERLGDDMSDRYRYPPAREPPDIQPDKFGVRFSRQAGYLSGTSVSVISLLSAKPQLKYSNILQILRYFYANF